MLEHELIGLAVLFFFIIIGSIISSRFKQPLGIGLLLVGAIIGPNMLNLIREQSIINIMIEIGSILLLFVIGLEFVLPKFVKIGAKAIVFGILKMGIIFFMTYSTLLLFGMNPLIGIIFGVILSLSSTVVIVKILESKKLYKREEMPILIGILLIEDVFAVMILTILSNTAKNISIISIAEKIIISITILCIAYLIMLKVAKHLISWFIKNSTDEIVPFMALGMCAGFSYLSYILGLSPATGAFLAGSIVASCPHVKLFEKSIMPYTFAFTSLFFISIGTLVDFRSIRTMLPLISILLILVILSRFIAIGFISMLVTNFRKEQTIFSSIAMISISEFSLLIAQTSMRFNLGIDFVSLTAFLIFTTAIIMSFSISHYDKVTTLIDTSLPKDWTNRPKSLSKYINLLLHELDIENTQTRKFKKIFSYLLITILGTLFIIIGWNKIIEMWGTKLRLWQIVLIHISFVAIASTLISITYTSGKQLYNTLINLLSEGDSRNLIKSRYVLNNLMLTLALFMLGIFSPVFIVMMKLPIWVNTIPFILLFVVLIKLVKIVRIIDRANLRRRAYAN